MSSDPRVPKSRQPKAYTDQQLDFLKSFLPEYERRSQGSIRGDSKKFAFQKAADYIAQFGLSPEFLTVEDGETRFKEQIYNWFKNTVGRNRRKAEGRTRSSASKKVNGGDEKGSVNGSGLASGIPWNAGPSTSNLTPYAQHIQGGSSIGGGSDHPGVDGGKHPGTSASPVNAGPSSQVMTSMQYSPIHSALGGSPMSTSSALHPTPNSNNNTASSNNNGPGSTSPSNNTHTTHTHNHSHSAHSLTHSAAAAAAAIGMGNPGHVMITQNTLREAFLTLDTSSIANLIQNFVAAHPSATPLTPVVEALFEASIAEPPAYNRDPHPLVRRYLEVAAYLPPRVVHAGLSGTLAAFKALQMQIRRNSLWAPAAAAAATATPTSTMATTALRSGWSHQQHQHQPQQHHQHQQMQMQMQPSSSSPPMGSSTPSTVTTSLSEDMQRIANERQRRKDHIQWARIHAASLELGMMNLGRAVDTPEQQKNAYLLGRAFSEMVARDAVWEADEAEWVAGIFVLHAVIRTAVRGDRRQREEYAEILRAYESRWKEIKDEVRQTMVTEVLLSSKEELARLEDTMS